MFDKLAEVEKRYQELEGLMLDPNLLGQQKEYSKLAKERSELEEEVSRLAGRRLPPRRGIQSQSAVTCRCLALALQKPGARHLSSRNPVRPGGRS